MTQYIAWSESSNVSSMLKASVGFLNAHDGALTDNTMQTFLTSTTWPTRPQYVVPIVIMTLDQSNSTLHYTTTLFVPYIADQDRIVRPHNLSCAPEIGITVEMALFVTLITVVAYCFVDCNRSKHHRAHPLGFEMSMSLVFAALAGLLLLNSVGVVSAAKVRPWQVWPNVNPFAVGKPSGRRNVAMTTTADGSVWCFGGYVNPAASNSFMYTSNELFKLDLEYGQWSAVATTGARPSSRFGHAMAAVGNTIFIFGGNLLNKTPKFDDPPGTGSVSDLWSFSTETSQWLQLDGGTGPSGSTGDMQNSHHGMGSQGMVSVRDMLFVFGGANGNNLWCFSLSAKIWKLVNTIGPRPDVSDPANQLGDTRTVVVGRHWFGMASSGDSIYMFGGGIMLGMTSGSTQCLAEIGHS